MTTERSAKACEIIAFTRILLGRGGYKSFSFADIAEQVNIRKASIHHHFPSKEDLVKEVVIAYRQEALAGMHYLDKELHNPQAELMAYMDYWAVCIRDGSSPFCLCAMLATELPLLPDSIAVEVSAHFTELADWLASLLRKGCETGELQLNAEPIVVAKSLMATVHGAMLSARAFNNPELFVQIVHPVIAQITTRLA